MSDLDDIERCLDVGRPAVLSISAKRGGEATARAIIRGWQRGSYVLLDIPDETGLGAGPRVGDSCRLRFLAEGDACGLDATVIDLGSGSHFSFVKIAWPHNVTMTRVRKHQRVQVNLPCTVHLGAGDPIPGEIQDISAGGCRLAIDRPLPQRVQINVHFTLPGKTQELNQPAETCASGAFVGGAWIGCKFTDISEELRYDIDFFVATTAANLRIGSQSGNRILIIHTALAEVAPLRQALSTQGYDVTVAHNVLDGFFWLRASTPSVVMLHADLKPFRGLDILTSLRALPAFETLPVIIFGGTDADQSAALKAGASQYLVSSAQVQELVAAVVTSINPAAA